MTSTLQAEAVVSGPMLEPVGPGTEPAALRSAFALFPSGLAAVSAVVDGEPLVVLASSFQVGISLDPPLVLFAVQHTSRSWPRLRRAPRLGVSLLGEAQAGVALQLGARTGDRFAGISTTVLDNGAHLVDGCSAYLDCTVHAEVPAGDHDVVLLEVRSIGGVPGAEPLVWHGSRFRALAPRPTA